MNIHDNLHKLNPNIITGLRAQVHHQVPDEEGAVLGRCHRQRGNGRGRAGPEPQLGRQLPRFAAQEELAERQVSQRQVHHGQAPEIVLEILLGFVRS